MFSNHNLGVGALNPNDYHDLAIGVLRTSARPSAVIEYILKKQENKFPEHIISTDAQQLVDIYLKRNLKIGLLIVKLGNILSDERWLGGPLEAECLSKTYPNADIYTFAKSGVRKDTALNFLRYIDFLNTPLCLSNGYYNKTLKTLSNDQMRTLGNQLAVIKNNLDLDANRTASDARMPDDAFTEKVYQVGATPMFNESTRNTFYTAAVC